MHTGTPVTVDSLGLLTDYLNYDERPTVVIEYINASKLPGFLQYTEMQHSAIRLWNKMLFQSGPLIDLLGLCVAPKLPTCATKGQNGPGQYSGKDGGFFAAIPTPSASRIIPFQAAAVQHDHGSPTTFHRPSLRARNDELYKQNAPTHLPSPESRTEPGEEVVYPLLDWIGYAILDLPNYTRFFQSFNQSQTALEPMENQGDKLCSHVFMIMNHPTPRVLWGSEFTIIYNGLCAAFTGEKHPGTFGLPRPVGFAIDWEQLHRNIKTTIETGKATTVEDHQLPTSRNGLHPEETYWSYTLLPALAKDGSAVGVLKELTETTQRVLAKGSQTLQTWLRKWTQLEISPSSRTTWLIT